MIFYPFTTFPSVILIDKYGIQYGVGFGMILTTTGFWLRCLANISFTYAVVGQTIMAIGMSFILNAPTRISAKWFPIKERIISTSFGVYSGTVGMALGCFIPAVFFSNTDTNDPELAKEHYLNMSYFLAIISTMTLIPILIFFRNKPEIETNDGVENYERQDSIETLSLWKSFKILIKDRDWTLSSIAHGISLAYSYSFTIFIPSMITIYGFTSHDASYLGTSFQISGLASGVVCSTFLSYKGPSYFKITSQVLLSLMIISNTHFIYLI